MKRKILKSISLVAVTLGITISFISFVVLYRHRHESPLPRRPDPTARSFVMWLHGLGGTGPGNEPIVKAFFTSAVFANTTWSFPSAPSTPVTGGYGFVMPSWFDILELPVTANSPQDEGSVLKAVQNVHAVIDKEIATGTNPKNVFISGFSQGGALTLASILLYPKTLGGGAVFSAWVPFNSSIIQRVKEDAKKTPIMWIHGMADDLVLFEAGLAGPPFLEKAGLNCEFKYENLNLGRVSLKFSFSRLGHYMNNEELRNLESWIKSRLQSLS